MVFWFLVGLVVPPAVTWLWRPLNVWITRQAYKRSYNSRDFVAAWFRTAVIQSLAAYFIIHILSLTTGHIVSAIIAAIIWWVQRKRRKSLEALGAKSKALRDALVKKMRNLRVPSPVLRPGLENS
jgi:hypothetical protein